MPAGFNNRSGYPNTNQEPNSVAEDEHEQEA